MNKQKRLRSPRIKPTIKKIIALRAIRYPTTPRLALANDLRDYIERLGEISPSEETLIKMISDARNKEINPIDSPWHLGIMREPEYGISPEAIPYIFQVKEWCDKNGKETPITVRQAFWIAQFCHIHRNKMKDKETGDLWKASWVYAQYEIVCELSDRDFDTTELDIPFWYGGPAGPLVAAILSDMENGTRHMNSASKKLIRKRASNERSHNKKSKG